MADPTYLGTLIEGLSFPESPRWFNGRLWFSDFYQHAVFNVDAEGRLHRVLDVPQQPSGLGWMPNGDLLVVSMLDKRVLRVSDGKVSTHADLSGWASAPCNDMVVTSDGSAYVGNFGFDRHKGEAEKATSLLRISPDGAVNEAATSILFPNGCAVSQDGRRLYLAESFGHRILRYQVSAGGLLQDREVVHESSDFFPDGLCLDADESLWVANPISRRLQHLSPHGEVIHTLGLPGDRLPIACVIGGSDGRVLYVASCSGLGPGMAALRDGRIEMIHFGAQH